MALRGNFSRDNVGVGRYIGGGSLALTVGNMSRAEYWRSWASPDGASAALTYAALPTGCYPPVSWRLPIAAGELSAHKGLVGAGSLASSIAGGVNGEVVISGVGDLAAIGELIVSLQAALTGSGTISGAALQAFLNAVATLAGSGDASAQVTALGSMTAANAGDGGINAVLTALGELAAEINVTGATLTTANVADAILDAAAGVESDLTVRQALRLIAAAVAGKISGAAGTTITIRNAVNDDKDRIVATVTSEGNRTAVSYDLSD